MSTSTLERLRDPSEKTLAVLLLAPAFLLPYWSQGKEFNDASGKLTLDKAAAGKGLQMWLDLADLGVLKNNVAAVQAPDTVHEFKAGIAATLPSTTFAAA